MNVTIMGLGLIGSSLAYQLKNSGCRVTACARRRETLDKAQELKIIDYGYLEADMALAVLNVDLIVVALPIELIVDRVIEIDKYLQQKTVVIDVGSTKQYIVEKISGCKLRFVDFIGGHPMAGSDKVGLDNYIKDLFRDKPFIFTYDKIEQKAETLILELCGFLGAKYLKMSAVAHDEAVAGVSHLPYLLAVTLYNVFLMERDKYSKIASSGFKDTSRVAHSDPLWGVSISITNKLNILEKLDKAETIIGEIKKAIVNDNIEKLLSYLNVDKQEISSNKINLVKKLINVYD